MKKNKVSLRELSENSGVTSAFLTAVSKARVRTKFYRQFSISKRDSSKRTISSPLPNLSVFQQWVLENVLNEDKYISKYAKAYRTNYSIKQNVKFHRQQDIVLKLDIEDFFGNIKNKDLFLIFKKMGYSNDTAGILANLCSLGKKGVPQGAPTSPVLSNLVLANFDEWCGKTFYNNFALRYTRYADDITLSGSFQNISPRQAIAKISQKLFSYGFSLNINKIKVQRKGHRQIITGITVNDVVNVNTKYRKNLRLEIHHYLSDHRDVHLRKKFPKNTINEELMLYYTDSLIGKINYILYINPKNKGYFEQQKTILKQLRQKYTERTQDI